MATATEETQSAPVVQNNYEGMFLVDSTRFANDPDKVTKAIMDVLEKAEATVVTHRPWLDGKLAYPINGRRKGLHYLVYFTMAGDGVTSINRSCKLSDTIRRHLVIKHPQTLFDAMVAALNPTETEEAPAES